MNNVVIVSDIVLAGGVESMSMTPYAGIFSIIIIWAIRQRT